MRLRALLLAVPLIVLAACSSGTDSTSTSSSGTGASGSCQCGCRPSGRRCPPATAVAAPVPADQLPTASGAFGEKPTLTFPAGNPVPSLQRVILSEGTGPVTAKGDWLITNYLGQVWGGEVFDNSYDRGTTSAFQIGAGKVVPGWDTALVGVPVGSRVMLSLPPADGYGPAGNSGAGIKGTDTLVFVVDIVDAVGAERRRPDRCHRADPAGGRTAGRRRVGWTGDGHRAGRHRGADGTGGHRAGHRNRCAGRAWLGPCPVLRGHLDRGERRDHLAD